MSIQSDQKFSNFSEVSAMESFLKTIIIGIAIIFGDLLLGGYLHNERNFSTNETFSVIVLTPIVLVILYFILKFFWWLVSETASESTDTMSFLITLITKIVGIAILIYGLYFLAQIAICIGILVLGLGFAAGLLGIGGSGEYEINRLKEEITDLERERDSIPTYNGFLGGSGISESKLKRNRRRRDDLNEKIQEKNRELDDMLK